MTPITGIDIFTTGQFNQDGRFELEIPVECQTLVGINVKDFHGFIGLTPNEETYLEFTLTDTGISDVATINKLGFTSDDVVNYLRVTYLETINYQGSFSLDYRLLPDSFAQCYIKKIEESLSVIKNSLLLSETAKEIAIATHKQVRLSALMNYKRNAEFMHSNEMKRQGKEPEPNDFVPEEPGKSYYAFLRYFDLNNPVNLQTTEYFKVLRSILENETLRIPPIGEMPVETWLSDVKSIMSDLIGADSGLFYEMLAAHSYVRQFNNELKPLSDKQKENIKKYFKGKKGEVAKILLNRNDEIVKWDAKKEPLVVNETPAIPKEKLMDAIVSKYQGKVVIVDFWATWCAPCLIAMEKYRDVKSALKDKNVVFVYIADESSPRKLWEEKIKGIGGEHYYLNREEWESISYSEKYEFDYIPTYLIFDKKGELKHKITNYPGNEEIQRMIEKLL